MIKQSNTMPRRTSAREVSEIRKPLNVMQVLANPYPENVDEYAVHLYHKAKRHNHFFRVHNSRVIDEENAELHIEDKFVKINIRTGVIVENKI